MSNIDMDLLNLRRFTDTKIATVFWIDKRLIWYDKDVWGSRAEIDSVSQINWNSQIRDYATILDDFMTNSYKKFVNPKFEYRIQSINDKFVNENEERKLYLDEVKNWVRTRNEYRQWFSLWVDKNWNMDRFSKPVNQDFI
jgi:hypothetical protein